MKKYKVNGIIVEGNTCLDAISKIKDSVNYEYLLSEERKAVEDYKKAISETNDKNELYVLSHILKEEAHHIELLENLQKGKVTFSDSIKDEDKYVVYAEETWNNYRALFKKKLGPAKYSSEADADKFTEEEAEKLAKPTSSYNWVKKKV